MRSVTQTPKRAVLYARVSTEAQATDEKTSLSEQLLALRKHADSRDYKIVEEISEEISGRKQDTEGLERIRDLAESGEIDAVLVYKWNRLARTVARFESFMLEMKLAGVEVVSLDGQSNETAGGRMFNRLMAVFSEYQRDDLVETMQQGKRGRARSGRIVPTSNIPYGYEYDRKTGTYRVDEGRMAHVRRIFRMIGKEGRSLWAVKRTLDSEGVPTPRGGHYWDHGTLRDIVLSDLYRPHTREQLEALVEDGNLSPEVYATLDPPCGIQWYNRHKSEVVHDQKGEHHVKKERPRSEWIAVPVEDAGISPAWVDAAREKIINNVRPSNAGRRVWMLKGHAYCACGSSLKPFTVKPREHKLHFYYICEKQRRHGAGACPHAKYYAAGDLEERVVQFVLDLIRDPETLREQFEADIAREKADLRRKRKHITVLSSRLGEIDTERERLVRLYTRGGITDDEFDAHTEELAARKKSAEEELANLEDVGRYIEYLDILADDILEELPEEIDYMPRIREYERLDASPTYILPAEAEIDLTQGKRRKRTPEEMEQLRREAERERAKRYQNVFDRLNLKVVAYPDGDLEISWTGGVCKLSGTSRWTPTGTWSARGT
jgi:site-specific DNA recombinase